MKREKISLTDLLRELVAQSCEGFEKKGCLLVLKIEDQVNGYLDKLKLGQVITNLLSNALKYGSGNTVEIGLEKKNGKAILEIKDHGIGMTPDNIKNLFQPYSRFAEESSITGLGLGLYISEQIIQAHGGQITVESSLGVGSLFRVELPLELSTS